MECWRTRYEFGTVMMDSDDHVMTDNVPSAMAGGVGMHSHAVLPTHSSAHAGGVGMHSHAVTQFPRTAKPL